MIFDSDKNTRGFDRKNFSKFHKGQEVKRLAIHDMRVSNEQVYETLLTMNPKKFCKLFSELNLELITIK